MRGRLSRSTDASSKRVSESSPSRARGLTEAAGIGNIVNAAALDVSEEVLQSGAVESALLVELPQQIIAAGRDHSAHFLSDRTQLRDEITETRDPAADQIFKNTDVA